MACLLCWNDDSLSWPLPFSFLFFSFILFYSFRNLNSSLMQFLFECAVLFRCCCCWVLSGRFIVMFLHPYLEHRMYQYPAVRKVLNENKLAFVGQQILKYMLFILSVMSIVALDVGAWKMLKFHLNLFRSN